MTLTKQSKKVSTMAKVLLALILIMPLICGLTQIETKADTSYYATWDDYKASGAPATTWNDVVDAMEQVVNAGKEMMAAGDTEGARQAITDAYYGYYETTGFERIAMGYISGSRKTEMELQFSTCKGVAKNGGTVDEYNQEADTLVEMLRTDANILDGTSDDSSSDSSSTDTTTTDTSSSGAGTSSGAATFAASFGIMLREGVEAILIVGAIIAYLKKSNANDKKKRKKQLLPVYLGAIIGIVASFGLAGLLTLLKLANTDKQELIEGITALLAVAVLVYVTSWMISHSEQDAWSKYIKNKAKAGGVFALAFTAFLAVFREGAEVVLFYQPLIAKAENIGDMWAGFFVACGCLVIVYFLINVIGAKLPLKPFFVAMSILMALMAVSFIGAGIKELIEGDVIGMTSPEWLQNIIPYTDFLDVCGVYPILETLIPQLILLIFLIIMFVLQFKKNHAIHMEAEEQRRIEREKREAYDNMVRQMEFENSVRVLASQMVANGELSGNVETIAQYMQQIPEYHENDEEETQDTSGDDAEQSTDQAEAQVKQIEESEEKKQES